MPVLPDDGSISVWPGLRTPSFSASSIMRQRDPVLDRAAGFCPSSLMRMRTSGFGLSALMSTSGVFPISSRAEP